MNAFELSELLFQHSARDYTIEVGGEHGVGGWDITINHADRKVVMSNDCTRAEEGTVTVHGKRDWSR